MKQQTQAENNRTLTITPGERIKYGKLLSGMKKKVKTGEVLDSLINDDIHNVLPLLPDKFVDLMFIDPPYNLTKKFNSNHFKKRSKDEYRDWMENWLSQTVRLLKPNASIYVCGDWRTSSIIQELCEKYFNVINRITFERDKGRGSLRDWKNSSEDIWFCANSRNYYFNSKAVKLKRVVNAPYRKDGQPKDWQMEQAGNFRETMPSNLWTDITIPFWSMPENTPHPTQKPEKLLAKIILASSREGDVVFDPFAGSVTTGVVAKKLNRRYLMVELDKLYSMYGLKRMEAAEQNRNIQGYLNGVFWERNSLKKSRRTESA